MSLISNRLAGISRTIPFLLQTKLGYCSTASNTGTSSVADTINNSVSDTEATTQPVEPIMNDSLDMKAVEKLIIDSSKDMPVDMTNPYEKDRMQCLLCRYNVQLDYKNVKLLSQFVSSFTGTVYDRHITRLCKTQQDRLVEQIRRSRNAGFMPTLFKRVEFLKDPKLFDPNNPIRPHPH